MEEENWQVVYKKMFPHRLDKLISWVFPTTIEVSTNGKIERIWKSGWFSSNYKLKQEV